MALVSEGQEYSSPSKRLKLDHSQQLSNYNTEFELETFPASTKNICDSISGGSRVSAEDLTAEKVECSGLNFVLSTNGLQEPTSSIFSTVDSYVDEECRTQENGADGNTITEEDDEDDDKDEISSTVSNLSNLSGLSDLSGQEWKPIAGPMSWVQRQMLTGVNPRNLLNQLIGDSAPISDQMDDLTLWKIIVNVLSEIPRRQKLRHVNTLDDVVRLLKCSKNIIVLTGAGVSVSCGIPDFRSRDGIYARLAVDFPDLPDPQAMFDISYFSQDPRPFFKFAREIYPGQFKPSPCHRFIKMLEKQNKLLRNYSQNIDTLEQVAGIKNVIECHGSFATASCTNCKYKVTADAIREDIFAQRIPICPKCSEGTLPSLINSGESNYKSLVSRGIMKPDIVFFGEGLPEMFHESMAKDKDECDLLIVIGSSLKVRPVALIPSSIPAHVPQILINREMLPNFNFDVQLLGDSDVIISQLCYMLGGEWLEICSTPEPLVEAKHLLPYKNSWRSNCDDSWEDRSSDPCPTDCSRESLNVNSSNQDLVENKNLVLATTSVGSLSVQNASCREAEVLDSEDTKSAPVSLESSPGVSADSTISRVYKERHMSVDSSTRDSGVYLSTDNLMENMVGFSKDNEMQSALIDSCCKSPAANTTTSHCETVVNSSKLCDNPLLSPDSTTATHGEHLVLSDSSRLCAGIRHTADSTSAIADSSCNTEVASISHRHMSVDSTRDSGIDGCSSIDSGITSKDRHTFDTSDHQQKSENNIDMLRACWEPKIRESLASRLPENSYYFVHPNRYIFPGAEVLFDPDDNQQSPYSSSGSSSDSSDSGSSSSEESDNEEGDVEYWEGLSVSNEKPSNGRCP